MENYNLGDKAKANPLIPSFMNTEYDEIFHFEQNKLPEKSVDQSNQEGVANKPLSKKDESKLQARLMSAREWKKGEDKDSEEIRLKDGTKGGGKIKRPPGSESRRLPTKYVQKNQQPKGQADVKSTPKSKTTDKLDKPNWGDAKNILRKTGLVLGAVVTGLLTIGLLPLSLVSHLIFSKGLKLNDASKKHLATGRELFSKQLGSKSKVEFDAAKAKDKLSKQMVGAAFIVAPQYMAFRLCIDALQKKSHG